MPQGWSLAAINAAMRSLPTGRYTVDDWVDESLHAGLRDRISTEGIKGLEVTGLLQSGLILTGRPFGAGIPLPQGGTPVTGQWKAPLFEMIASAWITKQAMDRAVGMPGSEFDALKKALQQLKLDWDWLCQVITIGDGTGRLARVSGVANSGGVTTVTCDNTYTDFGWENVKLLKKGQIIEIYTAGSGGTASSTKQNLNGVGYATITAVKFGDRANGAATTGYFQYASAGTDSIANGDIVYLNASHSSGIDLNTYYASAAGDHFCLPIGLTGLVQDDGATNTHLYDADGSTSYSLTTFESLTRSSYPVLYGKVVDGSMINGGACGTPGNWDLSVMSDVASDAHSASGKWINEWWASPKMAACIGRQQQEDVTIIVKNQGEPNEMGVSAGVYARAFTMPKGEKAPIFTSEVIPDNCIFGLCTDNLMFNMLKEPDFLKLYGDIWGPTKGDSYAQFEAPFGGYENFSADQLDSCVVIKDLKSNL